ncbi:hypothetical protein ASF49_14790 [Methylobacterium sp. Leaf104]|uniref:flagellar hook-length control protein FliK n=1 Tax=Methylobacterium TaxID=407 RepID=UPI0006FE8ABC|nr:MULTISPECIES: flagellar hook-length control protein FliK [Methylobacterium]KQP29938.1 hypothetical protein ASF49_14790 [Methylobacterium sp. Leaf104]MCI9882363.1 flagellar hook-length control protein FliK [Methylobacterium goesingense]
MNTLGATSPGPRALPDALGPRGAGADAPDSERDAFGTVLGALSGRGRPDSATPEADRPGRRRDDEAESSTTRATSEETDPLALLALVVPAAAPAGMPTPKPEAISLEALVARAAPAQASGPAGQAAAASAAGAPDLMAGTDPAVAGLVPQPATAEARTRVAVLQRETHFAPVLPSLLGGSSEPAPAAGPPAPANAPVPGSPGLAAGAALPPGAATLQASGPSPAPSGAGLSALAAPPAMPPVPPAAETPRLELTNTTVPANLAAPVLAAQAAPDAAAAVAASVPGIPAAAAGDRSRPPGSPRRDAAASAPESAAGVAEPAAIERAAATPRPILRAEPVPASGDAATRAAGTPPEPVQAKAAEASLPAGSLPGPASAPAQQVAAAVLAELPRGPAGAVAGTLAGTLAGALPGAPAGEGPLKLLTLQLHPADLGTVLVRMRLRDGQLELSLQASREDSARLLREGGAVLDDLLRQGGYRPESVTVTVASSAADGRGAQGNPGSQQGQGAQGFPSQGESGANQGRATPDQAGGRSSRGGDPSAPDLHERMHESASNSPDRSGVYL